MNAFLFVFPIFFVGVWLFVLRLIASLSGWTKLAERFHDPGKFQGKFYRLQSAKIKQVNFNNALGIGVNQEGLYLIPMILLRPFHKPLLIPWREIQPEPYKKLWFKGYRLTFTSFPDIPIVLSGRTFEKMLDDLKTQPGRQQTANADSFDSES